MVAEITEQYLKIIFKLTEDGGSAKTTDIASAMDIAPASVTEMLHKLADHGFIKHTAYKGAVLTPKGRRIAKKIARKHRLLERFLSDIVGVKGASGHEQACKMEHALSDEAEHNLCKILNHPEECPHGRKIPKCDRPISPGQGSRSRRGSRWAGRSLSVSRARRLPSPETAAGSFM
jgi:DtxR family Mn-dependent transcriptional regulator